MITADSLPDDIATLKALVLAGRRRSPRRRQPSSRQKPRTRNLEADVRARALLSEQMKFTIAKLKHEQYGPYSEGASMLD